MTAADGLVARYLDQRRITPDEAAGMTAPQRLGAITAVGAKPTEITWSVVLERLRLLDGARPKDAFSGLPLDSYTNEMP